MYHKIFHYYPVDVKNSYTGKDVKGFKFPAKGDVYDATNAADVENLQQMQIYFGVHTVIASLQDLMRVGTNKTNKLYKPLYKELIEDYKKQCIAVLSLASSMCWVVTDPDNPDKGCTHKLTPDQALYEIEPAIKGLMLAVQRKMDLTFPAHLVKNIARLEIEKEILDIEAGVKVTQYHCALTDAMWILQGAILTLQDAMCILQGAILTLQGAMWTIK